MSATGLDAARPEDHRRDIDGLRALAVMAIVAFHAAPALVPGGYVGVDVFFVISGFLITRIIVGERAEGRFSFARFYLRRARRILPAYLLVVAVVGVAAYALFLPDELQTFGWALGSAGLFLTNVVFANYPGYFDPLAEQSPLLHLWSLSVEEQFYLVWPLLIAGLSLAPVRRLRPWLALALLAASLAAAQLLVTGENARLAFFHLPFRAWEFLLGGLLVLGNPAVRSRRASEVAVAAGLILIVGSAFLLGPETPFPGLAAVPACLGAALVIGSGGRASAAAPLRLAPMVWLGLISYSLYLWHWPLLVFARLLNNGPLSAVQTGCVIAASVLAAIVTWRFVEQPWRGAAPKPCWRHLAYGAAPLAVSLAAGLIPLNLGGLPQRLPATVLKAAATETGDVNPNRKACFGKGSDAGHTPDVCRTGSPIHVLVWGDSHADALTPGVLVWAKARGYAVQESANGGCPPIPGARIGFGRREFNKGCATFNAAVLREIAAAPDLKLIVLIARWPIYAGVRPDYDINSGRVTMWDGQIGRPLSLEVGLDRTLTAIAATHTQAQVVLMGPVPELPQIVPRCIARKRLLHLEETACLSTPSDLPLSRIGPTQAQLDRVLARHPEVATFRPAERLCHDGRCDAGAAGVPIYFDDDHIAASAAAWLAPQWIDGALATLKAERSAP